MLSAQYYDPKSRSLKTYRDLPAVSIVGISPNIAQDVAHLSCYAADTLELDLFLLPWKNSRDTLFQWTRLIFPGKNSLPLYFYGVEEGNYSLHIYCRNEKLSHVFVKILR